LATLTTQTISRAGTVVTPVAAAGGGDAMEVGSQMMLEVVNGAGAPITVTLAVPAARTYEANVAITSPAIAVTNGTTKWIGPIDGQTFMDPTTGLCTITYSSATSVTVAAVKLSQP
jgi:hypothetical protein